MALSIRLSRGGSKKRPYYRIVVADARSPRDGKYLEKIGTYNPLLAKDSEQRVQLDADRARHWLDVGAQPTDRVARFLDAAGVKERAVRNNPTKGKPGEKATERAGERAEKLKAAEDAAAEASAAPAVETATSETASTDTAAADTDTADTAEASAAPAVETATSETASTDTAAAGTDTAETAATDGAAETLTAEA